MAARAYWSGQIRLALVSIPVEIYSATRSGAEISFKQIHAPTGKPIHYEKVVTGIGPVDKDEIAKGFEVAKGEYVLLDQAEIDAVKLESKKTLEMTQFVDAADIPVLYHEKPYFVVPQDNLAEEAFIVLREALKRTRKVGLGQLALRGRETLVSLRPCGRGMVLETLRYADEVNKAQGYFRDVPDDEPSGELLELAEALIEKKAGPFTPEAYHDRYVDAVRELIEQKRKAKGAKVVADVDDAPARSGSNVIDLMAALKKSVEKSGAPATPASSSDSKATATSKPAKKPAAKAAVPKSVPAKAAASRPAARKAANDKDAAPKAPARKRA